MKGCTALIKKNVAENLMHIMSVVAPEDIASGSKRPRMDVPVLTANPVSTTTTDSPDIAKIGGKRR